MTAGPATARAMRYGAPLVAGLAIGLVASCDAHDSRTQAQPADQRLTAPTGLEAVQQGCRTNQPWATDAVCREAAEAIRRRFQGGGARYTPHKVDPFPSRPATPTEPAGKTEQASKRPSSER